MAGQGVSRFEWSWALDGSGIAYIADQDASGVFELYASQPDGGNNVKLSGNLTAGGDVTAFEWGL
jgi:hypothetical protein